jgi:hypothetical protein
MSEAVVNQTKLTASDFQVFLKALTLLAKVCTDVELKDNRICVRTNDAVVTYHLQLPLSETIDHLQLVDIADVVKLLKGFTNQDVTLTDLDNYYLFKFEDDDVYFKFTKPQIINNPYNYDKVQRLLQNLNFDTVTIRGDLFDKIRSLVHKFGSDLLVDLENKQFLIKSKAKTTSFTKPIENLNTNLTHSFKILQNALPITSYVGDVEIGFSEFDINGRTSIFYKISGPIQLGDSLVSLDVYGLSEIITDTLEDV